jgi:hypothetical protein
MQTAAEQITNVAADLQWPAGYPQDLEIDKRRLNDLQPEAFAWFLTADFGTYLMLTAEMVDVVRECAGHRRGKLYIYQRGHLRSARGGWDTARAALAAVPQSQRRPEYELIY